MKRKLWISVWCFALAGFLALPAYAQDAGEELSLKLNRDWGYGGFGGDIEGRFSLIAEGPANLQEVQFLLDGEVINVDSDAPFRYQFETEQFDPGVHKLSARGLLSTGDVLDSPELERLFLSKDEANSRTTGVVGPIIVLALVIGLGSALIPALSSRKKVHVPGQYGAAGGAVCPRCGLPFSRSFFGLKLLVGKLERCPHCGKWSIVRRASGQALEAAEARLASEGKVDIAPDETEKEKLARLIDESRFDE